MIMNLILLMLLTNNHLCDKVAEGLSDGDIVDFCNLHAVLERKGQVPKKKKSTIKKGINLEVIK